MCLTSRRGGGGECPKPFGLVICSTRGRSWLGLGSPRAELPKDFAVGIQQGPRAMTSLPSYRAWLLLRAALDGPICSAPCMPASLEVRCGSSSAWRGGCRLGESSSGRRTWSTVSRSTELTPKASARTPGFLRYLLQACPHWGARVCGPQALRRACALLRISAPARWGGYRVDRGPYGTALALPDHCIPSPACRITGEAPPRLRSGDSGSGLGR